MASPQLAAALAEIAAGAARDRQAAYRALLPPLFAAAPPTLAADLGAFLAAIQQDAAAGVVVTRALAADALQHIADANLDAERTAELYAAYIAQLTPRAVSFEDQITVAREHLAKIQEEAEDWKAAAHTLIGIPLESTTRVVSEEFKLKTYVHIVRLFLEDDDTVNAEAYLNRAAHYVLYNKDPVMDSIYKLCQARILDAKRDFEKASHRYLEVSFASHIDPEERGVFLSRAVTCAVLAPAGPTRARLLATLYKDERCMQCLPPHTWSVLEKMHLGRILRGAEVHDFASTLAPHHLAVLPDKSTVLDRAVIQHNVLAASYVYANIAIAELGNLLGIPADRAEETAARMIEDKRLRGRIDQIDGYVYFDAPGVMEQWDMRIASLCADVDDVVAAIAAAQPAPEAMVS